jgi:hypothetical protein
MSLPDTSWTRVWTLKSRPNMVSMFMLAYRPPPNWRRTCLSDFLQKLGYKLKAEVQRRWPMTNLLDILKGADLRVRFTDQMKTVAVREVIDRETLQKRLILSLYGLGTNTGLKRISAGEYGESYKDLLYIRRKFIHKDNLRNAIAEIVNAIMTSKRQEIWGDGTTSCASDSKKFGAWDQNLMTEWHIRYHGRGVMIYWHVEKNSTCIYSQLKSCSSSEVAAMIEGLLRHCTDVEIEKISWILMARAK